MKSPIKDELHKLYKKIENTNMSNEQAALEYASLWWSHDEAYRSGDGSFVGHRHNAGFINHIDLQELNNIALMNVNDSSAFFTKKALLISDNIILSDINPTSTNHHIISEFKDVPTNGSAQTSIDYKVYLRTERIEEVGRWIKTNKELILSGYATYFPDIKSELRIETWYMGDENHIIENPASDKFNDIINAKSNISSTLSRSFINDNYLRAIAEIEIPYIEGVSNNMMVKLIEDKSDILADLRISLKENFLELNNANGAENFDYITKKIGNNIHKCVKDIRLEIEKLNRKTFFQVTGAITAVATATLVAINGGVLSKDLLNSLLGYLGAGSGIISVSKFFENYLENKSKIKEMPYYFIWLFHKK